MQIQKIQSYRSQPKINIQHGKTENISFTGTSACSKKGCGFIMALSIATVTATITAPVVTYNYLSENKKDNGKIVNILTSLGTGIAAFGLGTTSIYHANNKFNVSKDA